MAKRATAGKKHKKINEEFLVQAKNVFSGCVDKCSTSRATTTSSSWNGGRGATTHSSSHTARPVQARLVPLLVMQQLLAMIWHSVALTCHTVLDSTGTLCPLASPSPPPSPRVGVTLSLGVRRAAVAKLVDSLKNCFRTAPSNCIWCDRPQNASSPT